MDKQTWTDDLRRKMADHSMSPPDHLWECIDSRMREEAAKDVLHGTTSDLSARQGTVVRMTAAHRRRMWAAAAVVAGMVMVGGGVWMQMGREGNGGQPSVPSVVSGYTAILSQNSGAHPSADDAVVSGERQPVTSASAPSRHGHPSIPSSAGGLTAQAVLPAKEEDAAGSQPSVTEQEKPSTPGQEKETARSGMQTGTQAGKRPIGNTSRPSAWEDHLSLSSTSREDGQVSLSLMASNFLTSSSRENGYGELVAGSLWREYSEEDAPMVGNQGTDDYGVMENVIVGNDNGPVYTEKKHRQPVKVGLVVSIPLTGRLSVGTGLTYSYLSSELQSGTEKNHYATEQKLHYVGVPLNLSYSFFKKKRWNAYAVAGGMVEKCVSGKSTTYYTIDKKLESTQHDKVVEKRLQYSVNAAVGIQTTLIGGMGIYFEPGISYHFDNHSTVTNIYKDTPLNLSLGMGIRYSF